MKRQKPRMQDRPEPTDQQPGVDQPHRVCRCGHRFPIAPGEPATTKLCRACAREAEQNKSARRLKRLRKKLNRGVLDILDGFAYGSGSPVPHQAEILEAQLQAIGGVEGLIRFGTYHLLSCEPGDPEFGRQLDRIYRMIEKTTESGSATKRLDLMSDEELLRTLDAREELLLRAGQPVAELQELRRHITMQIEHQEVRDGAHR